jgi:hypothetical protein
MLRGVMGARMNVAWPSPALAPTRAALAHFGDLSAAASARSDAIVRSLQGELASPPGAGPAPFLATDAGNRALQTTLNAGLAWLGRHFSREG